MFSWINFPDSAIVEDVARAAVRLCFRVLKSSNNAKKIWNLCSGWTSFKYLRFLLDLSLLFFPSLWASLNLSLLLFSESLDFFCFVFLARTVYV